MNWPTIAQDRCELAAQACQDPRCSDPAFAAANPELCSAGGTMVVAPEMVLACAPESIQFAATVRSAGGDVAAGPGVVWASSDASIVSINATSGEATALAAGLATISATWQGFSAFAQVNVLGVNGNCCDNVTVLLGLGLDNSLSMGQPFDGGYATKLDAAKAMAAAVVGDILTKDQGAVLYFNSTNGVVAGLSNDPLALSAAVSTIQPTQNLTDLAGGFSALQNLLQAATGTIRVILLVSDGASHPALSTSQQAALVAQAQAFKAAGNLILCVGVRAVGAGFTLLDTLASGGFFINVWGGAAAVATAVTRLQCSLGYFCAGSGPTNGYGCDTPEGPQSPDPSDPWDLEDGPPPTPPAPLPAVSFSPASGTLRGTGLSVVLSVPGHPNADILYSMDGSANPADPAFGGPVGTPYEGANAPVLVPAAGAPSICLKAIARESGWANSPVSQACYPPTPSIQGQLSGLRWDMPCIQNQGVVGTCVNPPDQKITLQGNPGQLYQVTLRFRGIVETFKDYTGAVDSSAKAYQNLMKPGDSVPKLYQSSGAFVTGGTFPPTTLANTYALIISDPPQTYYLNRKPDGIDLPQVCMMIDYQETIPIRAGATVTLHADSHDGLEVINAAAPDQATGIQVFDLFVPGVAPYPDLSVGQFIQMDVVSVA